ncbi:MAG: hypothetical protein E7813_00255 [Bradyrhizobium sp.]|nr:MAG: hypothetical protein E7813_00255 [Bradyrhizobium sp.]
MTKRDGSKGRASAICIRREHLLWDDGGGARKNGGQVLISAAKPRDFNVLPGQGCACAFSGEMESG